MSRLLAVLVATPLLIASALIGSTASAAPGESITVTVVRDLDGNGSQGALDTTGVQGIEVQVMDSAGTVSPIQPTDATGAATFDLTAVSGPYRIVSTIPPALAGDWVAAPVQGIVSGETPYASLVTFVDLAGGDSGDIVQAVWSTDDGAPPIQLGDRVWWDTDRDGIQDPDEPGTPGVTVSLVNDEGNVLERTTGPEGQYFFDALDGLTLGGDFQLEFDFSTVALADYPPGVLELMWTTPNAGTDGRLQSKAIPVPGDSTAFTAPAQLAEAVVQSVDAGLVGVRYGSFSIEKNLVGLTLAELVPAAEFEFTITTDSGSGPVTLSAATGWRFDSGDLAEGRPVTISESNREGVLPFGWGWDGLPQLVGGGSSGQSVSFVIEADTNTSVVATNTAERAQVNVAQSLGGVPAPGIGADTDFMLDVRINGGSVVHYLVSDSDDAEILDIPNGATVQLSLPYSGLPALPPGYEWTAPVLVGPNGEQAVGGVLTFTVDANAATTQIANVTVAPARLILPATGPTPAPLLAAAAFAMLLGLAALGYHGRRYRVRAAEGATLEKLCG